MISVFFRWLRNLGSPPPAPSPPDPYERLGGRRNRVLWCLAAGVEGRPTHLRPAEPGEDVFALFQAYASDAQGYLLASDAAEDWWPRAMAGALRMLCGDLGGADLILDNLPPIRPGTDGARGACVPIPSGNLIDLLPLPEGFTSDRTLLAGSEDETRLRVWLAEHRVRLEWREGEDCFALR